MFYIINQYHIILFSANVTKHDIYEKITKLINVPEWCVYFLTHCGLVT